MNRIRLTESQLHKVIRRCINEALDDKALKNKYYNDIESAKDYEDGYFDIWYDENCDDDMPMKICIKIWKITHPNDVEFDLKCNTYNKYIIT